ncbi:MAG: hypothetical protein J5I41_00155 [Saprospiraceae bacterium]|nr:hypothetical protein [Saprospiraceae bacterium]
MLSGGIFLLFVFDLIRQKFSLQGICCHPVTAAQSFQFIFLNLHDLSPFIPEQGLILLLS